uniref:helix-turn-helix domain-containing protein n=1 Tax=Malonomonas rubra TaxID=57040 RepID=UPI0026EEAA9B
CGCVFPCLAKKTEVAEQVKTYPGLLKLDDVLKQHINRILEMTGGKVHGANGAAELLGINPSTLRNKMTKLGIAYGRTAQQSK